MSNVPDVGRWKCVEHGVVDCQICFPSGGGGQGGGSGTYGIDLLIDWLFSKIPRKITPGDGLMAIGLLGSFIGIAGLLGILPGAQLMGSFIALLVSACFILGGAALKKGIPALAKKADGDDGFPPGYKAIKVLSLMPGFIAFSIGAVVTIYLASITIGGPLMAAGWFLLAASRLWREEWENDYLIKKRANRINEGQKGWKFIIPPNTEEPSSEVYNRRATRYFYVGGASASLSVSSFALVSSNSLLSLGIFGSIGALGVLICIAGLVMAARYRKLAKKFE